MNRKGCNPLLELRKGDLLSVTGMTAGLAFVRSSSGAVLLGGTIHSPKSYSLQLLGLLTADTRRFHPALLFRLPCEY
jgi:hypothetical protein